MSELEKTQANPGTPGQDKEPRKYTWYHLGGYIAFLILLYSLLNLALHLAPAVMST